MHKDSIKMSSLRCAGTDVSSTEEVAVKLESVKSKHPQLLVESRIYKLLQDGGMYLYMLDIFKCNVRCMYNLGKNGIIDICRSFVLIAHLLFLAEITAECLAIAIAIPSVVCNVGAP